MRVALHGGPAHPGGRSVFPTPLHSKPLRLFPESHDVKPQRICASGSPPFARVPGNTTRFRAGRQHSLSVGLLFGWRGVSVEGSQRVHKDRVWPFGSYKSGHNQLYLCGLKSGFSLKKKPASRMGQAWLPAAQGGFPPCAGPRSDATGPAGWPRLSTVPQGERPR